MQNSEFKDECRLLRGALHELKSEVQLMKKESQHVMKDCRLGIHFASVLMNAGSENCIEIGAGFGFLTRFIAKACKNVVAVEVDLRLLPHLKRYVKDLPNVDVVGGDGLYTLAGGHLCDTVVSNTPYKVTGPIIAKIVKSNAEFAVLTVQKEVAERLTSSPGMRRYGRLTAFVKSFMSVKKIATFPPSSFFPKPQVNSTLIVLRRVRRWNSALTGYEVFLQKIFNQKRKILRKVLKNMATDRYKIVGNDILMLRIYQLSPVQLWRIYELIKDSLTSGKQ